MLVLNSYHRQYRWTDQHVQGVLDGLADTVAEERLFIEYMDSRRMIDDAHHLDLLASYYAHKFERVRPDVVMVSDDSALTFALKHRQALFPGVPIVFYGINSWSHADAEGIPGATGVLEGLAVDENLALIQRLQPEVQRIVVVSDRTSLGLGMTRVARAVIPSHRSQSLVIELWDDFDLDELLDRVALTPPRTAYLMLAIHEDRSGRYFSWHEDMPLLARRANAPIYAMFGFVLGEGIVGGMMNDGYEHGHEAAAITRRVLAGTPADDIPVVPSAQYSPRFDYAVMRRFGIDESRLPPGSEVVGRPTSFYEEHRRLVWSTLAVIAGLLAIIAFLLRTNARVRRAQAALRASQADLRVEVQERTHAEQAMRLLAEASRALAESLDYEETMACLARLNVDALADWYMVDVLTESGDVRRVAGAHADPAKEPMLRELQRRYPPPVDSLRPAAHVLRTGKPVLLSEVSDATLRSLTRDASHAQLLATLGAVTTVAVPLAAHGQTLGALTLSAGVERRCYGPADLALAEELARRVVLSLDNARLYREAQEAIRLREEFVMVASHEINTPVAAIQLAIQKLLRDRLRSALSDEMQRMLGVLERQSERLSNLVGEMLDVAYIRAGRMQLTRTELDLAAVARTVAERLAERLARAQCTLTLQAGKCIVVRSDRARLEQVLTHLLDNAMKFGAGKPIEVAAEADGATARLVVKDHGIGLALDHLPRIFRPFEHVASVVQYGGLGLGLFIVHEIVTALGGQIHVDSTVGEGSTFTVELPRAGRRAGELRPAAR